MNEKMLFDKVRQLCLLTGVAIDKIAKECNANQDNVAELYIMTMKNILQRTKEGK